MPGLEDLYREIILDHYRNPRNRGEIPTPPAHRVEGFNPLCGDEIVVSDVKDLHYAYVYFDRHRATAIPAILSELERRGIYSIGRYGRWEHTSMEDAIGQGKQLAERLRLEQDHALSA